MWPKMDFNSKIIAEEPVFFHRNSKVAATVRVGAYSYFGERCIIGACKIGRFCSIATNVTIGLGMHDIKYVSTHPFFFSVKNGFKIPEGIGIPRDFSQKKYQHPIIGNDVWIGSNSVILRGTTIGDGAVIGAGAIVNKDVPPYTVVGGVPMKEINKRFSDEMIERLLNSKWWEYDISHFVGLDSSDPEKFLDQLDLINEKNKAVYKEIIKTP